MRRTAVAAAVIALGLLPGGEARGESPSVGDWLRRAETIVQSLAEGLGLHARDREVIAPPAGIDPKMELVPPRPHGTMRIITPPGEPGWRL